MCKTKITEEELNELKREYDVKNRELSTIGKERVKEHAGRGECERLFHSRLHEKVKCLHTCRREHRGHQAYLQEMIYKLTYGGGVPTSKLYRAMELEERDFLNVALWIIDIEKKIEEDARFLESLKIKLASLKGEVQEMITLGNYLEGEQEDNKDKIRTALKKISEIESTLNSINN